MFLNNKKCLVDILIITVTLFTLFLFLTHIIILRSIQNSRFKGGNSSHVQLYIHTSIHISEIAK